jgi:hypothetical protein
MAAEALSADVRQPTVPLWLLPLEWVNAPFASLSEEIRRLLGKAAIVTFIYAIAIFTYILVFRGR